MKSYEKASFLSKIKIGSDYVIKKAKLAQILYSKN